MPWLSKKAINTVFTLDLLMRAFFGWGELFVCHSSLCRLVRDHSRRPMIHILLLFYGKNLPLFQDFPANPDKFATCSLFAPQTNFSAPILHKFFTCANVLLEFYEPHFYSVIQFNYPDTQSVVFRHHSLHHFRILIICWWDWSSRRMVIFNIFLALFEIFVPLKNQFLIEWHLHNRCAT